MATDEGFKPNLERALSSSTAKPAWFMFQKIDDLCQFDVWIIGVEFADRIVSTARSHRHPKLWTLDSSKFNIIQSVAWISWLDVVILTAANESGAPECHAEPSSLWVAERGESLEHCKFVINSPDWFCYFDDRTPFRAQ
ncbi:hypothetical protein QC762_0000880 [Podospora pseudocomata]|uniref:Uncharacterized protein n=1 Tax=Podospora pseudocomata TaxID=2093779 RepID=A0ABR0GSD3_9PEZI|nr:hypothetical protein QC762_0000880 [Podospora pseudocomata]